VQQVHARDVAAPAARDADARFLKRPLFPVLRAAAQVLSGMLTFQDVGSPYTVRCVGANHNIADVKTVNQVSLIIGNSAGLIVVETGVSGLTAGESATLTMIEKLVRNKTITDPVSGKQKVYEADGSTLLVQADLFEDAAGTQPYRGQGAERRERLA